MTPSPRWAPIVSALFCFALAACTCGEKVQTIPAGADGGAGFCLTKDCANDEACGERHICRESKDADGKKTGVKCCERTFRSCTDDSGCCPGQVCTGESRCADKFDECVTDAECGEAGDRVCEDWTDPVLGVTRRCTYKRCGANGACPTNQFCFNTFCVASAPCTGQCPAGSVCTAQNSRCHPVGTRCTVSCKPGFLAVFKNPDNVYDTCTLALVECTCAELPPLISTDLGRHCSIAAASDRLAVAYYDGQYGDLVVSDFDADGKKLKTQWVDGIPANGTVVAGPSGPRGGVQEPGDVVGKYADVAAASDGTLYVSYYDETNGDLRFVERSSDGKWGTPITLDGANTDTGMFTSIALDPAGLPGIAYFQRAGSDTSSACAGDPSAPKALVTGVKFAKATVPHPTSISDWKVDMVDCAGRPPPPCFGCATAGAKVCTLSSKGTQCATPDTGCTPACATGEVCVNNGARKCEKKGSPNELADIPAGRGLFPSLAFKGTTAVIAWYDRTNGNLVVSQKAGGWTSATLDGTDGTNDTGDVGLFPSLAIDKSGKYSLAYHDFTRRALRYYTGTSLSPVANQGAPAKNTFIDTGLFNPALDGPSWVGADASLILAGSGTYVAYQNSTGSDLRFAKKELGGSAPLGPEWKLVKEWTKGGLGFFAEAAEMGGKLYIVHTSIHAKSVGGKPVSDNALLLEIVAP
jgi:hypothetical protein